jgi:alkanesulfonate monooxygenase SsuD/methylene tetrahydromethanopterin reductase-like flavin-dependent oxidoreductase (luciferase family)
MRFGVVLPPKIDEWQIFKYAEDLGYDSAWACDSQMLYSDCYATLALAAAGTKRIALGTGVTAAGTRSAPITAHSIASVSKLAPGRTFLGIGTGLTAMRTMGQKPMRVRDFEAYLQTLRGLLNGEEVRYPPGEDGAYTRFMNREDGFIDLEQPIPIYVAANGPRVLRLAGAAGDGLITIAAVRPEDISASLGVVRKGAADAGRELPADYHVASMLNAVVLQPGESVTSERVLSFTGAWVAAVIHALYEIWLVSKDDSAIPPLFQPFWEEYCDYVDAMETPADRRYLQLHDGHALRLADAERRFITEDVVRAVTIIGSPSEVAEQLRAARDAGVEEVAIQSPLATAREVMREFAEQVRPLL